MPELTAPAPLLEVNGVSKHFRASGGLPSRRGVVRAVDEVSLTVARSQTFGLVGESGSGKSTLGRVILQLLKPTAGSVRLNGRELTGLSAKELRRSRRHMQLVFQDPYASLNPRMRVSQILEAPQRVHRLGQPKQWRSESARLLDAVGLPVEALDKYPHEFSGGQRQRIGIARALATRPDLIVCDEPISALDVSIQAQVLNLLLELQEEFGLSYLFIAHDLSVVQHIADFVAVMYLGQFVEVGSYRDVFATPLHPYTQALLSAVPRPDPAAERARKQIVLTGEIPSPLNPPAGCRFRTRCPVARSLCSAKAPVMRALPNGHQVACHFAAGAAGAAGDAGDAGAAGAAGAAGDAGDVGAVGADLTGRSLG
ncbi:MAG: ABC transporter ATP-binding protein [Bifidobacteriaceae bacterium]|jgi:oligopeptide/dipeptide ABC transporter ATP-binding protein|nr:ABC transporter ATP-binding protein [Bifidobacteriaceae bacterium]